MAPKPQAAAKPEKAPAAVPAPTAEQSTAVALKLGDDLALLQPQIEAVLPEHVTVERFMRVVQTAIVMNPELRAPELRRSLFTAATKAATDGLVPDGREGAFVVFKNKETVNGREVYVPVVTWMPMVAGVIKKVRNSGELKSLNSNTVHAKDEFNYWIDDDGEHILHKPKLDGDRGEITAVYAIAKTIKGGVYTEVMSRGQIEEVRKASKAPSSPAWTRWYGEMGRKAVVRRLAKRLPMSTDLEQVIQRDDELYDFERERRAEAATSGVSALRKALSLDAPPSDGNDAEKQVEPDHVPLYDTDTALDAIRSTSSLEELDQVRAAVFDDFTKSGRKIPLDVEAAAHDHKATLEQDAA